MAIQGHDPIQGFIVAFIGFCVFLFFSVLTENFTIGAAIGGPIIGGGILYAMRGT